MHANVDILGIGETHLTGSQTILIPGFTWYGQNRTELHRRARTGSGGIGFLFSDAFLENFDITVLDDNTEGMMWVKAVCRLSALCLMMCVCYLPPEGSTRNVNSEEFMDNLLCKVYEYRIVMCYISVGISMPAVEIILIS